MIDLHCHLLPGIDDGAADLEVSLQMARMAVDEGTTVLACTPHIFAGVYDNTGPLIRAAVADLQAALDEREIPLRLVAGADVHVAPDLVSSLRSGAALTLGDSRYLLLEPPHHICPPNLPGFLFTLVAAGYCPVITHPERLSWIDRHYDLLVQAVRTGSLLQITAGSLTGTFGKAARYWAERLLDEGLAHIVASDAHDASRRVPGLRAAADVIARRCGDEEAHACVLTRPWAILQNTSTDDLPRPAAKAVGLSAWQRVARSMRGRGKISR